VYNKYRNLVQTAIVVPCLVTTDYRNSVHRTAVTGIHGQNRLWKFSSECSGHWQNRFTADYRHLLKMATVNGMPSQRGGYTRVKQRITGNPSRSSLLPVRCLKKSCDCYIYLLRCKVCSVSELHLRPTSGVPLTVKEGHDLVYVSFCGIGTVRPASVRCISFLRWK